MVDTGQVVLTLRRGPPRAVLAVTELRRGVFDVLIGINLLREGLGLPEVSLVSILDADKKGSSGRTVLSFKRLDVPRVTSQVKCMYADKITSRCSTRSMRRIVVVTFKLHTIRSTELIPALRKRIADITDQLAREEADTQDLMSGMAGIKTGFDYGMGHRGYTATITEEQQQAAMSITDTQVAKLAAVPAKISQI